MVSPHSKLKMFIGSVCVLLTSVSLKLIKTKNKINLLNHEFVRKKQNGGWKASDADWFYFSFHYPSWSESNFILFIYLFFLSDPSRSELIRSDFCICLAKMFVCPVPKTPHVMMKWCRRASHLGRFTLWNNGRRRASHLGRFTLWNNGGRATQLGRFTLWHYSRLATQLSRFTLWNNRRWASQLAGKFTLWLHKSVNLLTPSWKTRFDLCTRSRTHFPKKNMKA